MEQLTNNPSPQATPPGNNILLFIFIIMMVLILGVTIGFLGRPLVIEDKFVEVVVTITPNDDSEAVAQAAPQNNTTPTIMDFVLADARHFQGDADAPITIVEFSDFK